MAVVAFRQPLQDIPDDDMEQDDIQDAEEDNSELLDTLVQWVADSEDYFDGANERARRDRDYYDGRQWSDTDAQERLDLGRAVICVNRIARKIRFLKGIESSNRTSAKALPRTPAHEKAAEVITEGLRYVADLTRIDKKFSDAHENLLIEGIEILEVGAKQCNDGTIDPEVRNIPWDKFIYDPYSREKDFSDSRYLGVQVWMDLDVAIGKWPDKEDILKSGVNESPDSETYEDRPMWRVNTITGRDRVWLIQLYWKDDGVWQQAIFTESGFIAGPEPSFYVDEYGKPECPIIAGCAMVNEDNERYGVVREMIDLQDEINVRSSNDIDFSKYRQTVGELGAVQDVNETKRELQKPGGHVQITPGMRFEVLPTSDLSRNNLEALQFARSEIEMMGPNASMLGKDARAPSGRAIIASQEGGMHELSPFGDCHNDVKLRVYRAVWARIKQFWQAEKWIRITDDRNKPSFIGLNVPITYGQLIAQQNGGQIPPQVQMQYGPMLNQVAKVENQISYLDMDIVIEQVQHSAIMQQEQFADLVEMAKLAGPQAIPVEALIEASGLRDKEKILKKIEESKQQNAQQNMQQAELMAKKIAAEIEQSLAAARKADAEALMKTIEAQIHGLQAQTYGLLTPPVQLPPAMQQNLPPPGMPGQPGMMGETQGVPPFQGQLPPDFTGV